MFETMERFEVPTDDLTVMQMQVIGRYVEDLEADRNYLRFNATRTDFRNICDEHGIDTEE